MFKILGVLVAVYVVYAIVNGEVRAKSGISARTIDRETSPGNFWLTIVIYTGLSAALMFYF